jgi:hypothetical protein
VGAHASQLFQASRLMPGRRRSIQLLLVVAAIGAIFFAGFLIGKHQSGVKELTGRAYITSSAATVTVDGWSYGIYGVQFWIDSAGAWHDGGWPSCLRVGQRPMITFGAVPASMPDGISFKQVLWVDCRG